MKHEAHYPAMPEKMKPSMYLEHDEARRLSHLPVGSRISTTATGRITSMSREKNHEGKTRHSARIEFDRVRHKAAERMAVKKKAASIRAGY